MGNKPPYPLSGTLSGHRIPKDACAADWATNAESSPNICDENYRGTKEYQYCLLSWTTSKHTHQRRKDDDYTSQRKPG
jgi:hypothetical protein